MKHFLLFSSLSISTLFLANSWISKNQPIQKANRTNAAAAIIPKVAPVKMWVENVQILYKNDPLELHFAAPNAPFLGVIDPDGHFFYVVFPAESASGALKPLVSSDLFSKMSSLKIYPATFAADPYIFEVYKNKRVFTKSGKYTFILGENLHVDDPEWLDKLVIEYVHTNRPTQSTPAVAMN